MKSFGPNGIMSRFGMIHMRGTDSMTTGSPAPDEIWTVGEATAYLNAGGVDFRIKHRQVREMADDPSCPVQAVAGGHGSGRWRRLVASTVRAERARRLAELGRSDPDWSPPAADVVSDDGPA